MGLTAMACAIAMHVCYTVPCLKAAAAACWTSFLTPEGMRGPPFLDTATPTCMAMLMLTVCALNVRAGSWRGLLDELEIVTSLTPDDLRGVAQRVFGAPNNCFTGYVLKA